MLLDLWRCHNRGRRQGDTNHDEALPGGGTILRDSPASVRLSPAERRWPIFLDLCRRGDARGNLVPDAFLAALAIESNATLVTADRGFDRFTALRVEHPVDATRS